MKNKNHIYKHIDTIDASFKTNTTPKDRIIHINGSGALSGMMLLAKFVENNRIDDYLGQVRLSKD